MRPFYRTNDALTTNSYRRTKKKKLYGLKRISGMRPRKREVVDDDCGDVWERPQYVGPTLQDDYGYFLGPSSFHNQSHDFEMVDVLDTFDESQEEKIVVELLVAGCTNEEIKKKTSFSEYRVTKVRKAIRGRLKQPGIVREDAIERALDPNASCEAVAVPAARDALKRVASNELELCVAP